MKFIRLVCIALVIVIVINITQVIATPKPQNQESIKSFSQWCKQKDSLPKETKHTVEVLLKKAAAYDCASAEQILNERQQLILKNQISDLKPLAGLTNLTTLLLRSSKISDLSPLEGLSNLTRLELQNNPIKNKTCPVRECFFSS